MWRARWFENTSDFFFVERILLLKLIELTIDIILFGRSRAYYRNVHLRQRFIFLYILFHENDQKRLFFKKTNSQNKIRKLVVVSFK